MGQDGKVTHPPRDLTPLPDLPHGAARASTMQGAERFPPGAQRSD
jgi:hypothetical protein